MTVSWSEDDAEEASFLAIIPPPVVADEISAAQRAIGVDTTVPPHVTVKAQPGLGTPARWRPGVEVAIARVSPFELALDGVGWFGSGIAYLQVHGPIVELHRAVLDAVDTAGGGERFEYEGGGYEPHLTLAAAFAGASVEQLQAIADHFASRRYSFRVESVVELRRFTRDEPYRAVRRYRLVG